MAPYLIVLATLSGAFILSLGFVAGFWVRGTRSAGSRDALEQARTTLRELMHARKIRQHRLETASERIAVILRDRAIPSLSRRQLEDIQRYLIVQSDSEDG